MTVTTFHDFPCGPRDRKWDGAAAEKMGETAPWGRD
jgi:hypothetical protein